MDYADNTSVPLLNTALDRMSLCIQSHTDVNAVILLVRYNGGRSKSFSIQKGENINYK